MGFSPGRSTHEHHFVSVLRGGGSIKMKYNLDLNGFEGRDLEVEGSGVFTGARILVDGKPASKGSKRGQFILNDNNGFKVVVQLRQVFLDPVPQLIIDNQVVKLVEPLNIFQWIWSGLPLVLVILGGLIGGAIGGLTFWINTRVFRSEMSAVEVYILTGILTAIAVIGYIVIASIVGFALFGVLGS
jgi:hypothetical protein